jgi:hypothetical protein
MSNKCVSKIPKSGGISLCIIIIIIIAAATATTTTTTTLIITLIIKLCTDYFTSIMKTMQ